MLLLDSALWHLGHRPSPVNNGGYWDTYARQHADATMVGEEWGNEQRFLDLLTELADPAARAVEVGCGGGRITRHALPLFSRIDGLDVSARMLRHCRQATGNPAKLTLHRTDGYEWPLPDACADIVYSHDVFVHFQPPQVLGHFTEMRRVLRPGGRALVSFYDLDTHSALFAETSREYWRAQVQPPGMRVYFTNEPELRTIAELAGLTVTRLDHGDFLIAELEAAHSSSSIA